MRPFQLTPKRKKHLKGLLRAGAYVGAVSLVFTAVQLRSARAEIKNRTIEIGRQMAQLADATNRDVNKVSLNGQPMWLGSATTNDPASTVLDRYESYCKSNSAQPPESWRELANNADGTRVINKSFLSTGVMRSGSNTEGTVLCFTKNGSSKPSVAEAVRALGETGELGELGNVRYAYVKQNKNGGALVLTAWTDDKFNVKDFFPEDGKDSAGAEFTDIPRPPSSMRLFAAQIEDAPFGVNVYRSQEAPSKVVGFYDQEMIQRGWFAFDPEVPENASNKGIDGSPTVARLYERDGVVLTLASRVDEGGTFTALGLAGVGAAEERDAKAAKNFVP